MNSIIAVLTNNILPIFIVAGFGYALRRWGGLEKQPLSRIVFYCFSPCLVFSSLVSSQLPGRELADIALFTILMVAVMGGLAWGTGRVLRLSRTQRAAMLLTVMFVNGGNYGLTLNQLRYGDAGLARAVVYYTTSTMILYTVGIFIASTGQVSWRESLGRLWKMPPVYAAVLAIIVYSFHVTIPTPIMRGIEVAGSGAIPVMLVVLGMQMADMQGGPATKLAVPTITLRLIVAPLIAVGVATLVGLTGLSRSTSIIEASMPPAVFNIILATEFGLQPSAVTSIVVIATLLSPLTVAATISFFGL